MIENDEMVEYSEVYDDLKGVPRFEIEKAMQKKMDLILRLDYGCQVKKNGVAGWYFGRYEMNEVKEK